MFFALRPLAIVVGVAAVFWTAYASRGIVWAIALLVLVGVAVVAAAWIKAARSAGSPLHDPAISTLVFPPESKFQHSVLPRR